MLEKNLNFAPYLFEPLNNSTTQQSTIKHPINGNQQQIQPSGS